MEMACDLDECPKIHHSTSSTVFKLNPTGKMIVTLKRFRRMTA